MDKNNSLWRWTGKQKRFFGQNIFLFALLLIGCTFDPPEERFQKCFYALLDNNLSLVHKYFVYIDRVTISADEFSQKYTFSQAESSLIDVFRDQIGYNISNVNQSGDTMRSQITLDLPVFLAGIVELMLYEVDTIIKVNTSDITESNAIALVSCRGILQMIKEDGSWYICGNWEEQRQIETELAQERLEYLNTHVKTSNVRVHYTKDDQARLSFSLHNTGSKALSDVEAYIIGYTNDNSPCFTSTDHPLQTEKLGPKRTRRFTIDISQAPANWSGRIDVRILNCTFAP